MKRRPPEGNVRRVQSHGNNSRSIFISKSNKIIQCESHAEKIIAYKLDRDPEVRDFISQPLTIDFLDASGKLHHYTPDFQAWKCDGSIEIHEVTIEARRHKPEIIARETAGRQKCEKEGWKYIIHSGDTFPTAAEQANLELLSCFRSPVYSSSTVHTAASAHLISQEKIPLQALLSVICSETGLDSDQVCPAILHMVWHSQLMSDLQSLLFVRGRPNSIAMIWKL